MQKGLITIQNGKNKHKEEDDDEKGGGEKEQKKKNRKRDKERNKERIQTKRKITWETKKDELRDMQDYLHNVDLSNIYQYEIIFFFYFVNIYTVYKHTPPEISSSKTGWWVDKELLYLICLN